MKTWKNNFKETGDDTSFTKSQFPSTNVNFKRVLDVEWDTINTQPAFTCSKLTIEALEQGVKYVQS